MQVGACNEKQPKEAVCFQERGDSDGGGRRCVYTEANKYQRNIHTAKKKKKSMYIQYILGKKSIKKGPKTGGLETSRWVEER